MSIILLDGEATPVSRTYTAVQSNPDLTIWKDYTTNGGFPVGAGSASLSVRENAAGVNRVIGKIVLPTLETVAGDISGFTPAPTKAFDSITGFDLVFPNRTSLQNRKNARALLMALLMHAVTTAAVESFVRPSG